MVQNDICEVLMTHNDLKTTFLTWNDTCKNKFWLYVRQTQHESKWHTKSLQQMAWLSNEMHKIAQNWACVTSSSPGNQVDGLPGGVNTGAVVASWDPDRRATIHIFDMKNKCFEELCPRMLLLTPIFHLEWYVMTNTMQIFKWNGLSTEEIYPGRNFEKQGFFWSNFGNFRNDLI